MTESEDVDAEWRDRRDDEERDVRCAQQIEQVSTRFLLYRPPSQPQAKLPSMLNNPINANAVMPVSAVMPRSVRNAGSGWR